jgi:TM2 domain-containing membrane protein YozV
MQTCKEQPIALLLSVLGGTLGLDRFYLEQYYLGTLKFFTGGGFGLWYIFDACVLLYESLRQKTKTFLNHRVRFNTILQPQARSIAWFFIFSLLMIIVSFVILFSMARRATKDNYIP